MFETEATWGTKPELMRAYENIFNDDLSGQTEQRKRARLLPTGMKAVQYEGYGEKFKDTLDDYLITSICGHYGVQPNEIGFAPKGGGLGGAGFEEGRADTGEALGAQPLVNWISKMITQLSYAYLGMPRELEFKLMTSKRNDNEANARKSQIEVTSGAKTINEHRSEIGLPLLDTPQADMPILVSGANMFLFSPDGLINAVTSTGAPQLESDGITPIEKPVTTEIGSKPETEGTPSREAEEETEVEAEVQAEVKAFMKWANKGKRARLFEFKSLDPIVGEALNRCAFDGDLETARALAKAYLT
jgi:hypothetical protein